MSIVESMSNAGVADPQARPRGRESTAAFCALMASGLFWGLIWWPLKFFAGAGLSGLTISLSAYALIGLIALPVIWRERSRWQGEAGLLLAIGLLFGIANLAFTSAMMMGPVVRAMLLFYLLPAWGAIGGKLFLNERLGQRRLTAVGLSLAGVAVILGGSAIWQSAFSVADGVALLAGFCYTGAAVANRRARAIPLASRTLVSFVGCALLAWAMLPALAIFMPSVPSVLPALGAVTGTTWAWLLLFAIGWLLGGTLLTTYGVTHVQASRAAVLQVVELLVAIISAVLLGGETLGIKECIGGALIVAATVLEARA
jgi:drug/metabolite transporter (DMT)-like permease